MATVTIDRHPVLASSVATWTIRPGVKPSTGDFVVTPEAADALGSGKLRPVTLKFDSGNDVAEFKNLYVIEQRPGENEHLAVVRLVDRRWFWDRDHIRRSYNIRRHVGIRRVKSGFETPELDPLDPEIRYAPYSLNQGAPWNAVEVLRDVFSSIRKVEQDSVGVAPSLDLQASPPATLPIEDLSIDDNGAAAMQRVLQAIPGVGITVDADGRVVAYGITSGREEQVFKAMGPEQDGGGHVEFLTNSRIRPKEVHVLFTPEVELRLDFDEVAELGASVSVNRESPFIENVLPIPDYSLDVGGKTLAQGTWITVSQALNAWGGVPSFGQLSYDTVRKALVPYMDLWTGLRVAGMSDGAADWGARIAALQQHFRRTYRINQRVLDRVSTLNAYRTATINPDTGSRAPSTAFQDWSVVATQRFLAVQRATGTGEAYAYATNFEGYPQGGILGSETRAAPCRVSILDKDQGIIRLDFLVDENRVHEQILPSKMDNIPTGQLGRGLGIAWNSRRAGGALPQLSASHELITVVSVIPASPNNDTSLFRLKRKPSDVKDLLPRSLRDGLGDAEGPIMEVRVGAGWETARFAWVDKQGERILGAIGISGDGSTSVNDISDLCTNLGAVEGTGDNAASLDAIANGVAAAVYAGFVDRQEGSKTASVTKDAKIEGFIQSIQHRAFPDGRVTSTATASGNADSLDFLSLVPSSVRQLLLKIAEPGRQ